MAMTMTATDHFEATLAQALEDWDGGDREMACLTVLDLHDHPGTAHIIESPEFMTMLNHHRDHGSRESLEGFLRDYRV